MAIELREWLKRLRQSSLLLSQAALGIFGVISGFLLPPPSFGVPGGVEKVWLRLGQFFIWMMIGLVFIVAQKYYHRKDVKKWGILSFTFLLLATAMFFAYNNFSSAWACFHRGKSILMGSYSEPAELFVRSHPGISCGDLLDKFENKEDDVWTKASRDKRRLHLAGMYIGSVPLFTISIIAMLQAIYCTSPRPSATKKKKVKLAVKAKG